MKNTILSLAVVAAMTTAAVAGPAVETYEAPVDNSSFYLGLGYGFGTTEYSADNGYNYIGDSIDTDNITLQAGYNINQYVAVEGRMGLGLDNEDFYDAGVDSVSLFVKPQYPVTPEFSVYALIGYSWNTFYSDVTDDVDADGFAWGLGAKYEVVENVEVFADYTSLYSDTETSGNVDVDEDIYSVNVGVSYKF